MPVKLTLISIRPSTDVPFFPSRPGSRLATRLDGSVELSNDGLKQTLVTLYSDPFDQWDDETNIVTDEQKNFRRDIAAYNKENDIRVTVRWEKVDDQGNFVEKIWDSLTDWINLESAPWNNRNK